MTAREWLTDYRPLIQGDPMPATLDRFADPCSPDTTGLRLYARNGDKWYAAQIRGQTLCVGNGMVDKAADVTVEYEWDNQQAAAEHVKSWLRELGWKKAWAIRLKSVDAAAAVYAECGGCKRHRPRMRINAKPRRFVCIF